MSTKDIQPLVLAGGLGLRLRPRTDQIPKPLLPVDGRPLLWYALNSAKQVCAVPPIVVTGYKHGILEAYFEDEDLIFRRYPGASMAECVLKLAEQTNEAAYLCMSSDVIVPTRLIADAVQQYDDFGCSTITLATLEQPGHKSWIYETDGEFLTDVMKQPNPNNTERAVLIFARDDLLRVRQTLGEDVAEYPEGHLFNGFQAGWVLLLKASCVAECRVRVFRSRAPVLNVNDQRDLAGARRFVTDHYV